MCVCVGSWPVVALICYGSLIAADGPADSLILFPSNLLSNERYFNDKTWSWTWVFTGSWVYGIERFFTREWWCWDRWRGSSYVACRPSPVDFGSVWFGYRIGDASSPIAVGCEELQSDWWWTDVSGGCRYWSGSDVSNDPFNLTNNVQHQTSITANILWTMPNLLILRCIDSNRYKWMKLNKTAWNLREKTIQNQRI